MNNIEVIVQNQLDAYNARNLSQFSQCFNDQVQVYRHPDQTLLFANKKDMLAFYESSRFNQPRLHARLVNRIVMGNKVFDHELISGLEQQDKEVVAIYQVEGLLISHVWFVDP